jgi:FKBP-type peptidyl-prolyl cis-trans isomerase
MKNKFSVLLSFIILAALVASCSKYPGYKKTKTGLHYKFHVTTGDTAKPRLNDIMKMRLSYGTLDSLIMDGKQDFSLPMLPSMFKGDIYEGLALMSKGDSATFIIHADSFFTKIVQGPRPSFVDSNGVLYFNVKMIDFFSQADMMKRQEEENVRLQAVEEESLAAYLVSNNITAQPLESGLVVVELKKGSGKKPAEGNKVKVHYTGMFLDGSKFDSSYDHPEKKPLEFTIGGNQIIQGFEEGVLQMQKGGKAKLIIPSRLAYGSRPTGPIPAFSTLIFEIELIEVE